MFIEKYNFKRKKIKLVREVLKRKGENGKYMNWNWVGKWIGKIRWISDKECVLFLYGID